VVVSVADVNKRGQTGKKFFERYIEMVKGTEVGVMGAEVRMVGGVWTDQGECIEFAESGI